MQMIQWAIVAFLIGCGPSQAPPESPATDAPERTSLTQQECEAQGGSVVGDIGDGATQRPDYTCPSGKPPLGNIAPPSEGPAPIEGAVCCPS